MLADGRLASGGHDGQIKLWPKDGRASPWSSSTAARSGLWRCCRTGGWPAAATTARSSSGPRTARRARGPPARQPVQSLAVLPDGRLASGGDDGQIKLWPKDGTGEPVVLRTAVVLSLAVLPDGRLASGGDDGQIKLWPKDGTGEPVVLAHGSSGLGPWRCCRTGGWPAAARTARSSSGPRTARASPWSSQHGSPVQSLAVLSDGRLASGGNDGKIKLWPKDGRASPWSSSTAAGSGPWRCCQTGGWPAAATTAQIKLWPKDGKASPYSPARQLGLGPWRCCRTGGWPAAAMTARSSSGLLTKEKLIAALCLRAGRNLSKDEWARYIGSDTPWQPSCRDRPSNWRTPDP